jgi:hypothetical protein
MCFYRALRLFEIIITLLDIVCLRSDNCPNPSRAMFLEDLAYPKTQEYVIDVVATAIRSC